MASRKTKAFYVTVVRDTATLDYRFLLGPYATHEEALANVERAKKMAESDPRSHWYAFGTASTKERPKTIFGV